MRGDTQEHVPDLDEGVEARDFQEQMRMREPRRAPHHSLTREVAQEIGRRASRATPEAASHLARRRGGRRRSHITMKTQRGTRDEQDGGQGKGTTSEGQGFGARTNDGRRADCALTKHRERRLHGHYAAVSRLIGACARANVDYVVRTVENDSYCAGYALVGMPVLGVVNTNRVVYVGHDGPNAAIDPRTRLHHAVRRSSGRTTREG
jgi:hypothetical protein